MTRGEIRTRILEGLNESATSPVFFSLAQIDAVIEESMEVLTEEVAAIKRTAFIPLRPGTIFYYTRGIAPDIMAPYRIIVPSFDRRLRVSSVADLDRVHERWATVTAPFPDIWFPVSWDLFGVWPGTVAGGGVMEVDYLAWPRRLLDDDDEPELPEPDQEGLVLYGIYEGLLKQWDLERALTLLAMFMERWTDATARAGVRSMQARIHRMAQVGMNGHRQE